MTPKVNMAVAARIAAQMIFGHRSTVWRGDAWESETADLIESDIIGDVEHADQSDFPVDAQALRETTECALFSGRGEKRIGFAHQSYAEFLAAWYLHSHGLEAQRVLSLLCHPDDMRIPPQHTEAAIWLAALDGTIFSALVETEPLLLLRADLSDTTDDQKAQLAGTLLSSFAARTEFDMDWGLRQHYRKLAHPGLAAQLRPYILAKDTALVARRAAMEISSACNVRELAQALATIALDREEEHHHRLNAADAAADLADAHLLASLRPLALAEVGDDPEDQLKATVIANLWPSHISTKEIFDLLSRTRNIRCLGRFRYAPEEFVKQFSTDDLIVALRWNAEIDKPNNYEKDYESFRLRDSIMAEAWNRLDDPLILPAFADTAWACLDRYEHVFNRRGERENDWLEQDDRKRRMAVMALLEAHSDSNNKRDPISLLIGENQFILAKDSYWLLERYRENHAPALAAKLAKCIDFCVRWDAETAWLDTVIETACTDATNVESPLADTVALWMEPIWFGSDIENSLKEQHARQLEWAHKRPPSLDPPPPQRVKEALQEFEAGRTDAWMRLWQELSLPDNATAYDWHFENVTKFPAGSVQQT